MITCEECGAFESTTPNEAGVTVGGGKLCSCPDKQHWKEELESKDMIKEAKNEFKIAEDIIKKCPYDFLTYTDSPEENLKDVNETVLKALKIAIKITKEPSQMMTKKGNKAFLSQYLKEMYRDETKVDFTIEERLNNLFKAMINQLLKEVK